MTTSPIIISNAVGGNCTDLSVGDFTATMIMGNETSKRNFAITSPENTATADFKVNGFLIPAPVQLAGDNETSDLTLEIIGKLASHIYAWSTVPSNALDTANPDSPKLKISAISATGGTATYSVTLRVYDKKADESVKRLVGEKTKTVSVKRLPEITTISFADPSDLTPIDGTQITFGTDGNFALNDAGGVTSAILKSLCVWTVDGLQADAVSVTGIPEAGSTVMCSIAGNTRVRDAANSKDVAYIPAAISTGQGKKVTRPTPSEATLAIADPKLFYASNADIQIEATGVTSVTIQPTQGVGADAATVLLADGIATFRAPKPGAYTLAGVSGNGSPTLVLKVCGYVGDGSQCWVMGALMQDCASACSATSLDCKDSGNGGADWNDDSNSACMAINSNTTPTTTANGEGGTTAYYAPYFNNNFKRCYLRNRDIDNPSYFDDMATPSVETLCTTKRNIQSTSQRICRCE
jgi:hypothetical protein